MENQPFPSEVSDWRWDTLQSLSDSGQSENLYLEYKEHLLYADTNQEKSKKEWKRNIEREFTAFANASGGIIVFGMDDDGRPAPFAPSEHEISRTVSQLVQNTTPLVETDVSSPLHVPSENVNRIALAVRIYEATRKPVATSDSAYYARINDQKQPMNREQIESLFIEADRRQQAVRQLEMEIGRFNEIYESEFRNFRATESTPGFQHINIESLKEVLRKNNHLYADESLRGIVLGIFEKLRDIDSQERYYGRVLNGVTDTFYHDDIDSFNREQQRTLRDKVHRVHELLHQLSEQAGLEAIED
ncbi:ATP-binding protein [Halomicrobium salinisoli]|uniref:ATP-binding protein n=1 Tax=Halomicrobium salinisoli TaxID=2878391 RepID=UPI001CF0C77F|nr:ATP-binding protein [Halomicrobium salinisoli]